ncbi:hypothetical protein NFI96_031783 [Prochilodus magdalenae]|nr:hypothetical protein NFI96_031783 [Prochilodus magdalenae]
MKQAYLVQAITSESSY